MSYLTVSLWEPIRKCNKHKKKVKTLPLYASFTTMKEDIRIQKSLSNLTLKVGNQDVKLRHIELVHRKKSDEIRCEVVSTGILTKEEKGALKEAILKHSDKEAQVIVTFRYRL